MIRSLFSILLMASLNSEVLTVPLETPIDTHFNQTALLDVHPIPVRDSDAICPEIQAKAGLVMDLDTGIVLCGKNIDEPMPMASLTKIMTAIIILESHDLDEVVVVQNNFNGLEGVRIWLRENERVKVGDLLKALLIRSAGDAAIALAEYHSGSVQDFVEVMNHKAQLLNLKNTHFENPIGLDADHHYSSAFDLAMMTKYALRFSFFRQTVKQTEATIESLDGKVKHTFDTTNYLLYSYLDIQGIKTGTTEAAGQSLINMARNEGGKEVISVLLNSPQRFQENKSLIDWTFRSYTW